MTKKTKGNEKLKEVLGLITVIAATGLVLLLVYVLSHCDGREETPNPNSGNMESGVVIDTDNGRRYVRCPIGIGANTLKDVYITMGGSDKSEGINFYTIMFEDPKRFISEAKDVLGGSYVYRSTDTEEITLKSFAPVAAGIFMGELNSAIDHFYSKTVAEENSVEDGSKYVDLIRDALISGNNTTPTGELTEENEFYIRLYSENYPGLYYEVGFCTDENGMAYLTDMVTGKTVPCPDEVTVRMIG